MTDAAVAPEPESEPEDPTVDHPASAPTFGSTEDTVRSTLRVVGAGLLVAGVSIAIGARVLAHWRARLREIESAFWIEEQRPGSVLAMTGISLLDASDTPHGARAHEVTKRL